MAKEVNIIKVLIEKQNEELNISKVAKYANMDYKNTYNIIKKLEKRKVITLKQFGKNIKVLLHKEPNSIIYQAELERRQNLLKNKNFLILFKKLDALNFPFIALIFGSYAKKLSRKNSDIDLMVICEELRKKIFHETIDLLPLKIHLTLFNFEEFMKMLKTKEFNVVSEATKNNIILAGIEDYYRLIKNAE